jgi:hypothetical protein
MPIFWNILETEINEWVVGVVYQENRAEQQKKNVYYRRAVGIYFTSTLVYHMFFIEYFVPRNAQENDENEKIHISEQVVF